MRVVRDEKRMPFEGVRQEATALVNRYLQQKGLTYNTSKDFVEMEGKYGDFSSLAALKLAETQAGKKDAMKVGPGIAAEIVGGFAPGQFVNNARADGAYLNFTINDANFVPHVTGIVYSMGDEYGTLTPTGEKFIVEHTGVNPNKPWHAGHMRNAILGDAVAKLLRAAGARVEVQNYINDLGSQVAESVFDYLRGARPPEGVKFDQWLGLRYVEIEKQLQADEKLKEEAKKVLQQLEHGNNDVAAIGRKLATDCLLAQLQTSHRLGVFHDLLVYESDIVQAGVFDEGIERLKHGAGDFIRTETEGEQKGCLVMNVDKYFKGVRNPDKVLIRSNGTATYTAKDIAFHMWKFGLTRKDMRYKTFMVQPNGEVLWTTAPDGTEKPGDFAHANAIINLIDHRQTYPQDVNRLALRLMGFEKQADNYRHVGYAVVRLPEASFSGRKGTWIGYDTDTVLNEAAARAGKELEKRRPDLKDEAKKAKIAEAIGISAVRYAFLGRSPDRDIVFKWEEALSLEGDSGPYLQYGHRRAAGILEKAQETGLKPEDWRNTDPKVAAQLTTPPERGLVRSVAKMPDVVAEAALLLDPSKLCRYGYGLSVALQDFYEKAPVLKAPSEELKLARLRLVDVSEQTMRNTLRLVGVAPLEEM